MKNLKKVTALVIVLAMALSSVAFASFSDVSEDASYNEAVQVMSSLGLLVGYEDGTFGPDKTITRAEFAAVIVRALGMEDAAKGASVNTIFTDVPADHWASGYVQIANQQGIILGYGDGNFGPDDEVLYEQAVKMIECALGYGVKFRNVADAYPTSYLAQANADGITVGASGKIGDKASRAVVARLVYNSLDVPMMVQKTIGGSNGDEFQVDDSTSLLYSKLKIAKVEGTVEKLYFNKDQADQVSFKITKEDSKWDDSDIGYGSAANLTYGESVDVASMRGYSCVAYIDMNDDSDLILKAIAPKAGRNKTLTLTKKQVDSVDFHNNELSYYKNDSNDDKALKVKLDSSFAAYENLSTGEMDEPAFEALFTDDNADFTSIKLIENGNDNKYDMAIVEKYDSFVVDSANERTNTILANTSALKTYSSSRLKLDPDDDTITFSIKDKDGKAIALADIKKDDVVNVATSEDGSDTFYDIIVTNNVISGTISERSDSNGIAYFKIGDAEYKVAGNDDTYVKVGDEGAFIVDMAGNILYKTAVDGGTLGDFAFIIGLEAKEEFNSYTYKASIMNQKGEFSVVELANKIRINDASQKEIDYAGTDSNKVAYSTIEAMAKTLVGYKTNSSGQISQLITDFSVMNSSYLSATPTKDLTYKADGRIGSYFVTEGLNLFNSDVDIASAKKDDLSVVSASGLTADEDYTIKTIVYDSTNNNIIAALGVDIKAIASPDSAAMFVTSVGTKNDSNGDPATLLKGYVNYEIVEIVVPDDARIQNNSGDSSFTDFTKGDVVQYSANSNGEASGVSVVFTAAQILGKKAITNGDVDNQDDDKFVYSDYVYNVTGSNVYYIDPSDRDGDDYAVVTLAGTVPTVKVTLNASGDIRSINGDSAFNDINTDKADPKNGSEYPNTDKLIVMKYENKPIIAIVVTDGNY
ncbi:S-layer homology domain-containing protein [Acetivibrio sp. MSJd-27]|uniref:S-layer homology domain-containing protein n=1 Tax=Acetivibrio sp. MSJd-27 TaxID=2841523 RepID=UPI001C1019D0|nr:S-layer homology domain-containing protein [Acetivibrio sp. MSJd-27]MBU5449402.1 S-layer homology domain-containing protein [Acetivibrio sp. MSJd-27]